MKKKTWMILCACVVSFQAAMAQRITRQYDNVPFASVLKDMNAQQSRYIINFVYDELEDFRVTKHIQGFSVPDAIRQLIGFYPIKMTQLGDVIVVECTQKAPTKMTGHVIDSHHQPVEFANVALLSPTDSTLITGGVTNEDGLFVIPCEARRAIVRVSCVGYRTMYHVYPTGNIGTIALQGATNNLKTVVVKAMRQSIKMGQEGMVVDIQNSDLNKIGTASDVLRELPRVNVSSDGAVSVFAKGSPLIYINNRAIRSTQELQQLKSDNIKNVELSPRRVPAMVPLPSRSSALRPSAVRTRAGAVRATPPLRTTVGGQRQSISRRPTARARPRSSANSGDTHDPQARTPTSPTPSTGLSRFSSSRQLPSSTAPRALRLRWV